MLKTSCSSHPANPADLLRTISEAGFAATDMLLYLDTHPDDVEAMSYYARQNRVYLDASKKYADVFGPLTPGQIGDESDQWLWSQQPWPWECQKKGRA